VLTVIAVVVLLGVGVLVLISLIFAGAMARHIHINERKAANGGKRTDISTPFGDLNVSEDNGRAAIHIPGGGMTFDQNVQPANLGIEIYPGAVMLGADEHSAFNNEIDIGHNSHGHSSRLHMEMNFGDKHMNLNLAEFRTSDSPEKVLDFYRLLLKRLPGNYSEEKKNDSTELKVKNGEDNERVVGVKRAADRTTHFVLVRAATSAGGI
jgi:hypothetical protein